MMLKSCSDMNTKSQITALLAPLEAAIRLEQWDNAADIARELTRLNTLADREARANAAGVVALGQSPLLLEQLLEQLKHDRLTAAKIVLVESHRPE